MRRNPLTAKLFHTATLVLLVSLQWHASAQQQDPPTEMSKELVYASRDGLRAVARLVGHYVRLEDSDDVEFVVERDVKDLCDNGTLVVVARVIGRSEARLSEDGGLVTTDYSVTIAERLQGELQDGVRLTVPMPGGTVKFPDGTSASIRSTRNPDIRIGSRYVFFLRRAEATEPYTPFLGPQGVFLLDDAGRVISRARDTDDVFQNYNGTDAAGFLSLVRAAARQ